MVNSVCVSLHQLKEVVLKSGKVLRADVCVIGAGEQAQIPVTFYCEIFQGASHL